MKEKSKAVSEQKPTILLFNGDSPERESLEQALAPEYTVIRCENESRKIAAVLREHPEAELAIVSFIVAESETFRLVSTLRKKNIQVLIAVDAQKTDELVAAQNSGAFEIIIIPFHPVILRNRVRNLLDHIRTLRATEKARVIAEKKRDAQYDVLTGLYNRATFADRAAEMIRLRLAGSYVLICMDFDSFKFINDRFGFDYGDHVLRFAARLYREAAVHADGLSGHDMGDSFLLLLPNEKGAVDKLVTDFDAEFAGNPDTAELKTRFGCYAVDEPELDVNLMIDRARMALRLGKGSASHRVIWFSEAMRSQLIRSQILIEGLKKGIERGEFRVLYQPQYNFENKKIIGAEALARWEHPQLGSIGPSEFIPLFEKNGSVDQLDIHLWGLVCEQMRKWDDAGLPPMPISINLSRTEFNDASLTERIAGIVEKNGLKPDRLCLEITESACSERPKQLFEAIHTLRQKGFLIEVDDFGSGYSSLNTLKDFPADMLKLDMAFCRDASDESRGGSILSSVVHMAHRLHLPVIAEGVETREQAEYLKTIGCLQMQGYYFSHPLEAEAMTALLAAGKSLVAKRRTLDKENDPGYVDFFDASRQATLLFNSFIGGALILEYDGKTVEILRANDRFFEVAGISRAEFQQRSSDLFQHLYPSSQVDLRHALDAAFSKRQETYCEVCSYPGTDTEKGDLRCAIRLRFLSGDASCGVYYCQVENITQIRELNERLNLERQRVDMALQFTNAMVWEYDITAKTHRKLNGLQADKLENAPESLLESGDIDSVSAEDYLWLHQQVRHGVPSATKDILIRKPLPAWKRVTYKTLFDEGKPVGAIGIAYDITQKNDLLICQRELDLALNNTVLYFWTYDCRSATYPVVNKNAAALGIGERRNGKLCGIWQCEYLMKESRAELLKCFDKKGQIRSGWDRADLVLHFDFHRVKAEWLCVHCICVRDQDGALLSVSMAGEDISDTMRNDKAYQAALSEKESAEEEKILARLRVNLTTDRIEEAFNTAATVGNAYMKYLSARVGKVQTEAQKQAVLKLLNRDNLCDAFRRGVSYGSVEYQRHLSGRIYPIWVRTTVRVFRDTASGDDIAFLQTADIDLEVLMRNVNAHLTKEEYELIALLDPQTGYLHFYNYTAREEILANGKDYFYDDGLTKFINAFIPANLRESALKQMSRNAVLEQLREKRSVSVIFPVEANDRRAVKKWEYFWLNEENSAIIILRTDISVMEGLRADTETMRQVLTRSGTFLCTYNCATGILFADADYAAIFGLPKEYDPFSPQSIGTVVAGDREAYCAFYGKIRAGEPEGETTIQTRLADNSACWLKVRFQNSLDKNGMPVSAAVTVQDITAQRSRTINSEINHLLVRLNDILIFDYDTREDTLYSEANRQGEGIIRKTQKNYTEQLDRNPRIAPDSVASLRAIPARAAGGKLTGEQDFRADIFGIGFRDCRLSYRALTDESGKVYRIVGQVRDTQEEKRRQSVSNLPETSRSQDVLQTMTSNLRARCFELLVNSPDLETAIGEILALIGKYFHVSRVYLVEESKNRLRGKISYEWCAEGVPEHIVRQNGDFQLDGSYRQNFLEDGIFCCNDTRLLPEKMRVYTQEQKIGAFLQGVFSHGDEVSGFVGFDECGGSRLWTDGEKEMMRMILRFIGTSLGEKRLKEENRFATIVRAMLESSEECLYMLDPATHQIIYCNNIVRSRFGEPENGERCYTLIAGRKSPCENCPLKNGDKKGKRRCAVVSVKDGTRMRVQALLLHQKGKQYAIITCINLQELEEAEHELALCRAENELLAHQGKYVFRYDLASGAVTGYDDAVNAFGMPQRMENYEQMVEKDGIISPSSWDTHRAFFAHIRAGEKNCSCDLLIRLHNKEERWYHVDSATVFDDGKPLYAVISFFDNDEQQRRDREYQHWQAQRTAMLMPGSPYLELNLSTGSIEHSNNLIPENDVLPQTLEQFLSFGVRELVVPEDVEAYLRFYDRKRLIGMFFAGTAVDTLEYQMRFHGKIRWYRVHLQMVRYPYSDDVYAFVVYQDIDREKRHLERLKITATHDTLTGVFNRSTMKETIENAMRSDDTQHCYAVTMFDLDNLKAINDTHGHLAGDEALIRLANSLHDAFCPEDTIFRIGGDEFLVFSRVNTTREELKKKIKALQQSISDSQLAVSAGAVLTQDGEIKFEDLYREADRALYEAKRDGKNGYRIFPKEPF